MRYLSKILAFVLLLTYCLSAQSQISPGELTASHSDLEGISNCTKCHDLGNKVTNEKCLACHDEIQEFIDNRSGYHYSSEVRGKDCFECHSEHHGRKFDMVRFDKENFDHELTGYPLEGEHSRIDCRDCHIPDHINDAEIRKRKNTFLGLDESCLSCHDDYHQKTLDRDCKKCHNMDSFDPATKFDHNQTDFELVGKHIDVDCVDCHKETIRNGRDFQEFANIKHESCVSCHDDAHQGNIGNNCAQCHNENSFEIFIGANRFNHNSTGFKLRGKHRKVDCFECHQKSSDPARLFQDKAGISENQCIKCHEDQHDGRFGTNCTDCHKETSFFDLKNMDQFDHNLTDYPLQGNHLKVDCKECHEESYSEEIAHNKCSGCHEDYHNGEFSKNGLTPDCVECHSVIDGFDVTHYTLEKHNESEFPLEGAHLATPCFECHLSDSEEWKFSDMGESCTECHDNVHGDEFAIEGKTSCERCHDSFDWYPRKFDHNTTDFPLEGGHKNVSCEECHKDSYLSDTNMSFKIPNHECSDCH